MKTQDTEKQKIAAPDIVPVELIKVADICPDPKNRKNHDADELVRLAESICEDGLLQPITVRINPGADDGNPETPAFMIVAGERRWEAHRLLKREQIEARVVIGDSQLGSVRKRGAENIFREDLNPIEQAELFRDMEADGMTQDEIAKWAGKKSQSYVSNAKRLLALPADVKAMLKAGQLERAYGIVLCKWVDWPVICEFIAIKVAEDDDMTAKQLADDDLPYDWQLKKAGLVVEIDASTYGRDVYVITPEMREDPDYLIPSNWRAWCLNPAKWAKEKAVQDAAKAAKKTEAVKAMKSAKKGGDAKPTAEQVARKKKIEGNKAARALVAQGLKQALDNLRAAPGISSPGLRVVLAKASSFGYGHSFTAAAQALGIKLPKGGKSGMDQLGDAVMVKLVAAAIIIGQADDATKHASKLPHAIEVIAGKIKVPEPAKPKVVAKPVKVKKDWVNVASQTGARIKLGYTVAEVAKYCEVGEDRIRAEMAKQGLKELDAKDPKRIATAAHLAESAAALAKMVPAKKPAAKAVKKGGKK